MDGPDDLYDRSLAEIVREAEHWQNEERGASPWARSPWRWLTRMPPIPKSKIAARILAELLTKAGVEAEVGRGHERLLLSGQYRDPVVFKFSMATLPEDPFRFQQIRGRLYGAPIACFGVTPERAYLWLVPMGIAREVGRNQHGSNAEKWIVFPAAAPPAQLSAYGGSLVEGIQQFVNTWGTDRGA